MTASTWVIILICLLNMINGQDLYFPDDDILIRIPYRLGSTNFNYRINKDSSIVTPDLLNNGITQMTLDLQKSIGHLDVALGPLSITSAMVLLLLAAQGRTLQELSQFLGVPLNTYNLHENYGKLFSLLTNRSEYYQIHLATGIFVQEDYLVARTYRNYAENIYNSQVFNVNFRTNPSGVQTLINTWVRSETHGKIPTLLYSEPPQFSKIIVASAMYFKALWEQPFFMGGTKKRSFYPLGRDNPQNEIMVDMMTNGGTFRYHNDTEFQCELLAYPYKGNETVMYVILPWHSDPQNLKRLVNVLKPDILNRLIDEMRFYRTVTIFPKMTIETTLDLREAMWRLGVTTLFNPTQANLSSLVESNSNVAGLYASNIVHKVYMEITETGTEAASATAVSLARDGGSVTFRVDVPFVFYIRHERTNTILFSGAITKPTSNHQL